jgi:hypothetical protein
MIMKVFIAALVTFLLEFLRKSLGIVSELFLNLEKFCIKVKSIIMKSSLSK